MAQLISIDTRDTDSVQVHNIGTKYVDEFDNVYRYARAGAVALTPGTLLVNGDSDADGTNKTVARTYAAGVTEVIVDAGGAVTADYFKDGTFTVSDATGEGFTCVVSGNTVTTGAAEMTVYLKQPTTVALTIDVSEATLQKNPWDLVVISIADKADMPVGVSNVAVAINYYFWAQTRGTAAVLVDTDGYAKGDLLTIGDAVVGTVSTAVAGDPIVGVAQMAGTATEYQPAFLTID